MKYELWYAVINGGDGSASVYWFPSEELARFYYEYDLEIHGEGYAEDPVSCLCYEADKPVKIRYDYTKTTLLKQLKTDLKDEIGYQAGRAAGEFDYQPGIDKLKPLIETLKKIKDHGDGRKNV